jgi:hypothetical protein
MQGKREQKEGPMDSYEKKYEYKKGFDRGFAGKKKSVSLSENVLGFCSRVVGFEREREKEELRERGFQAGIVEGRMRKNYAGESIKETMLSMIGLDEASRDPDESVKKTMYSMIGLDENNKDPESEFEVERKNRGY